MIDMKTTVKAVWKHLSAPSQCLLYKHIYYQRSFKIGFGVKNWLPLALHNNYNTTNHEMIHDA